MERQRRNELVLSLLILGLIGSGIAETGPARSFVPEPYRDAAVIGFASGAQIDTRFAPTAAPDAMMSPGQYWLVHLSGPVRPAWLDLLRDAGVAPVCYIHVQTLVCRVVRATQARDVERLEFVDWLGPYPQPAKIAPELVGRTGQVFVAVAVWPEEDARVVAASCAGASAADASERVAQMSLDAGQLADVAALDAVAWIQEQGRFVPFNSEAQWVVQSGWSPERPGREAGRPVWTHGIRGQGMVVGLFDSGIYTDHDMFVDPNLPVTAPGIFPLHRKIAAYKLYRTASFGDAGEVSFHGSAVAATLCGDDSITGDLSRLDGMIPEARVYFVDNANAYGVYITDPDFTGLLDSVRFSAGMPEPVRQVSGSFGSGVRLGDYRLEEATLDAVCWDDKDFLVTWAAGNFGLGTYNIGHPACAKNALTVGSSENGTAARSVSDFSGRGPCHDGRIKPNLVAPGGGIATVDGHGPHLYWQRSGTSFSAPAASGALALLRQYFRDGWFPTGEPDSTHRVARVSSALMRALALTATDPDVGSEFVPNKEVGWGRLDLSSVMYFAGDSVAFTFVEDDEGLSTGQLREYYFDLDGRAPLRVVLAWTDTAAAPGAQIAIVNDLNLELMSPDGNRYRGNQLVEGRSAANPPLWDERNVEEVFFLNNPLPGRWTARIYGRNVYTPRQPSALAVRGQLAGIPRPAVESPAPELRAGRSIYLGRATRSLSLPAGDKLRVFASDGRNVSVSEGMSWRPVDRAGNRLRTGVYFYRWDQPGCGAVSGKLIVCR